MSATQRQAIPLVFTVAEIEERERVIAGDRYDTCDRVWLRLEAMRELRLGVEPRPLRSTKAVDETFEGAWSPAQMCRRVS